MRADRLVSLALLLQARGRTSARALAAELEVSVRTVYRDIAALNLAGVPVVTESGPGGGCWLLDGYRFPLRGLSGDEAAALLVLGVPTAVAELGLADALAAGQRKVRLSAGSADGAADGGQGLALVHLDMPRWFGAAEPAPWLRTLAGAVRDGRQLRLGYRHGDQRETSRVVGPLGLVNKAGIWYLVAAGGRRATGGPGTGDDEVTVFRVGRVTSAQALAAEVSRPAGFDLAAFWSRWSASFMTSRPRIEVLVRASPDAICAFTQVFGNGGRRAVEAAPAGEDGFRDVTLTFEHPAAAVSGLAGFGGEVEVLSPAVVRERLIAGARQLLERYGA